MCLCQRGLFRGESARVAVGGLPAFKQSKSSSIIISLPVGLRTTRTLPRSASGTLRRAVSSAGSASARKPAQNAT
eukprot:2044424-Alexandrium_andersonii.AAC.1